MIRVCSNFSNISVKWNNIDTNKLITINYQQFLLHYESNDLQKINDFVGYEMQCFFTSWNPPTCHSRKNVNCHVHQDIELNAEI